MLAEGGLVLGLLLVVLFSESVRTSTSLWMLFLYSFPAEFLVGFVPHEPVLIYYGGFYEPWVVALVAATSTVMAEALNYSFFGLFYGIEGVRAAFENKAVKKVSDLFSRLPFTVIVLAAFSPVPFFPVRFLVVITGYPVWKYLLGVFLARTPRFYLLAWLGAALEIPGPALLGLFLLMFVLVNLPGIRKVLATANNR